MKVKIGKFKSWFGPYQLAEKLCFWAKKKKDKYGFEDKPDWVHDFGEFLAHGSVEKKKAKRHKGLTGDEERKHTLLYKFLTWIDSKKKRKISVRIDPWDTWNAYHTLALVILPTLIQLRNTKHGSPWVDDEDVPEGQGLRSTEAPPVTHQGEWDDNVHKRWEWVIDEMIWAFEQILDDDAESQFHKGKRETVMVPLDKHGNEITDEDKYDDVVTWRMDKGDNDTSYYDKEGHQAWQDRVQRGTTLFGKYFRALWD